MSTTATSIFDTATRTEGKRRVEYVWVVGTDGEKEILATLTVSHTKAGVNYFNGEHTTEDYFGCVLRQETREHSNGFTCRGFMLFSGLGLFRFAAGNRYSDKKLHEAEANMIDRFTALYESGNEKVLAMFAGKGEVG